MPHAARFFYLATALAISLVLTPGNLLPASASAGKTIQLTIPAISKHTELGPGYVFDDFKKIKIKDPGDNDKNPYWWIINNGDGMQFYDDCGDASCVEAIRQAGMDFARLQIFHDETPPAWDGQEYIGTEISEYRTLYSYGEPGRWLPTPDHSVIISARVRFSANYEQDGYGGAVGSAGLWLWNSYPDLQDINPVDALGYNWVEAGSAGGMDGLQMTAIQGTFPAYNEAVSLPIDMSTWHVWSIEWSTDGDEAQSIGWRIDDTLVGETTLVTPFEALTLTFWNDNQFPTLLENGQFSVVMHNPGSPQNFDIDWVEIYQPQD